MTEANPILPVGLVALQIAVAPPLHHRSVQSDIGGSWGWGVAKTSPRAKKESILGSRQVNHLMPGSDMSVQESAGASQTEQTQVALQQLGIETGTHFEGAGEVEKTERVRRASPTRRQVGVFALALETTWECSPCSAEGADPSPCEVTGGRAECHIALRKIAREWNGRSLGEPGTRCSVPGENYKSQKRSPELSRDCRDLGARAKASDEDPSGRERPRCLAGVIGSRRS